MKMVIMINNSRLWSNVVNFHHNFVRESPTDIVLRFRHKTEILDCFEELRGECPSAYVNSQMMALNASMMGCDFIRKSVYYWHFRNLIYSLHCRLAIKWHTHSHNRQVFSHVVKLRDSMLKSAANLPCSNMHITTLTRRQSSK